MRNLRDRITFLEIDNSNTRFVNKVFNSRDTQWNYLLTSDWTSKLSYLLYELSSKVIKYNHVIIPIGRFERQQGND